MFIWISCGFSNLNFFHTEISHLNFKPIKVIISFVSVHKNNSRLIKPSHRRTIKLFSIDIKGMEHKQKKCQWLLWRFGMQSAVAHKYDRLESTQLRSRTHTHTLILMGIAMVPIHFDLCSCYKSKQCCLCVCIQILNIQTSSSTLCRRFFNVHLFSNKMQTEAVFF